MIFLQNIVLALAYLVVTLATLLITVWTAGAVYFDVGRGKWFAWPLTVLWFAAVAAAFWVWQPPWLPFLGLLIAFSLFLRWWFSQQPSNTRNWDPNFAVLPYFDMDGDTITAHHVRNTEYRTLTDFTPRYETRVYHLSNLIGVDAAITHWGSDWLCHPMLIFDFGDDGRLCISIEVRYRVGQKYGFFRSLYRQQEIIYVVCDERDAILKRSKYSKNHDVRLYRLSAEKEACCKVFLEYVVSANELVDKPQWYHGLTANCTTSVYRQRSREIEWDWRWLFNGKLEEMLYDHGRLDDRFPLEELKRISLVNEIANRAPVDDFGEMIRRELPAFE